MINYKNFTSRNKGYIADDVQEKISQLHVLIAGCGMGSVSAESLVRMGICNFTLVDSDTIEEHNLNRQAFRFEDIGNGKVQSLAKNMKSINPDINIIVRDEFLKAENVDDILKNVDLVVDTIDFVDFAAILALHDSAFDKKIPIISAINAGQGAFVVASHGDGEITPLRELFSMNKDESLSDANFMEKYYKFIEFLAPHMDPDVPKVMQEVLNAMASNQACPAPQLATGSYLVASIITSYIVDILSEKYQLNYYPALTTLNMKDILQTAA